MKIRFLLLVLFIGSMFIEVSAQSEFNVEEITVINLGDGRYLFRRKSDEKPIEGERRLIDGRRSEYRLAEFKDGLYDGKYQLFKSNILREEGTYKEGRKDGVFKEYNMEGDKLKKQETYKDGKLEGISTSYFTDGTVDREKSYKASKEDGPERKYDFETGDLVTELFFVDGKMHGAQRQRMSSSNSYEILSNYTNGVKDGKYSEKYVDNDVVRKEGTYKNGKEEGLWIHRDRDGSPSKEVNYKNGKLDGECKTKFFVDGTVSELENYKEGKLHGIKRSYFYQKKGKVQSEYNYKDGKRDGAYKIYKDDGSVYEEGRYENGKKM